MQSAGIAGARRRAALFTLATTLVTLLSSSVATAETRGTILRIDPRASQTEGAPVLTSVIELVDHVPLSTATGICNAQAKADDQFDCVADQVVKNDVMWKKVEWPEGKAYFTINVEGRDAQLKLVSKQTWKEASDQKVAGVGTAWLIVIDAGSTMGNRFDEAKAVASAIVNSKRDNDIFSVKYFNDVGIVYTLDWTSDKNAALKFIESPADAGPIKPFPASGRGVRELGDTVRDAAIDGFRNVGPKAPMHQAMFVLSSGDGGSGSASSTGPGGKFASQYMTDGRFPKDNLALPKMPVPVISIWFPAGGMEERFDQARAFMSNLANTEIGGFFSIIRDKSPPRGEAIVKAVRNRFDAMWITKWQASCVAPTIQQTFNLAFEQSLGYAGDGSYKDVPVGIDPKVWPLDVNVEKTVSEAEKAPIYPGGKVTVFGNFCWEGHKERAELYLLPKNQEVPATLDNATFEDAKNAQKQLIEQGLKATVVDAGEDFATFELPDKDKFLSGKDKDFTARMVILDSLTKRTSAVTKDKIITVKATQAPAKFDLMKVLIIAAVVAGVIVLLLLITVFRSGGKRRGSGVAAPPPRVGGAPAMAMAGPPMGMGGMSSMGGGGMGSAGMMTSGPPPAPPPPAPPPPSPGPAFVQRGTLTGAAGIFTVLPGVEMKAGRDGALCQILLTEPRVSGTHATLKIDAGQLLVRDDNSNNGTTLNGQRLSAGVWTSVPNGASLRFGPIEFSVSLE